MDVNALADLLIQKYGDRSKLPDEEEKLQALLVLSKTVIGNLRAECSELEREREQLMASISVNKKSKKK